MSSGMVAVAPVALAAAAPVLAVGGLAYVAVRGFQAISEAHQRKLEERERQALEHELSRLRVETERHQRLVSKAARLRVAAPDAISVSPTNSTETRRAVDAVVAENDGWEADLATEQKELNRQTRLLAAVTPRHDTLFRWVEEQGRAVGFHSTPPAFGDLTAVEEVRRQIAAFQIEIDSLADTLKSSRREVDEERAHHLWEGIRMAEITEQELLAEQPWRSRLHQRLSDELDEAGQIGDLPASVILAELALTGEPDTSAGRSVVTERVNAAIGDLQVLRASAATVAGFLGKLRGLAEEASELDSYVFTSECDRAREEFDTVRRTSGPAELTRWCRDRLRTLDRAKAKAVQLRASDLAWRRLQLGARLYEQACAALRDVGYLEIPTMETVVASRGQLIPLPENPDQVLLRTERRVFRQQGQLTYGKLVELSADGKLSWKTVKLAGPGQLHDTGVEADKAECRRQTDEDNDVILTRLHDALRADFGEVLADVDPVIDSSHLDFAGLPTIALASRQWDDARAQVARESSGAPAPLERTLE